MHDYYGDPPALDVLLVWDLLIHGDQYVKSRRLRGTQEPTIFQAGESGKTNRLAFAFRKMMPQAFINAFV
jgi:hypothetical protein